MAKIQKFIRSALIVTGMTLVPFYANATNSQSICIFQLVKNDNIGPNNQIAGVTSALKNKAFAENIKTSSYPMNIKTESSKLIQQINSSSCSKNLLIASGAYSLEPLIAIAQAKFDKKLTKETKTLWLNQQATDKIDGFAQVVDTIALPGYALSPDVVDIIRNRGTNIIETRAVPHNSSKEEFTNSINNYDGVIPWANSYISVFLGGDAPRDDNKMMFFTPKEAANLGKFIASNIKSKDTLVLITNSQRTGKFNPKTQQINDNPKAQPDPTTKALIDEIEKVAPGSTYFQSYDRKGIKSAFLPYLKITNENKGMIFVTGDLISKVSEIIDLTHSSRIYLMKVGSMNISHISHMNECLANKLVNVVRLGDNNEYIKIERHKSISKNMPSDADLVAAKVLRELSTKD